MTEHTRSVPLDEPTHALVRFAARLFGVSEAEVVGRAVREYARDAEVTPRPGREPWTPVDVYGEYDGTRVEGKYLPATRRLTVTSEPLAGHAFKSPSARPAPLSARSTRTARRRRRTGGASGT